MQREFADMFNILRRRPSQMSSQPILDNAVDRLVAERNAHLAEMTRLENIINDTQRAYNQHTRLYEALNNTLFNINHPFDAKAVEDAMNEVDFDLSVDQPSDDERDEVMPIPFASRRKARGNTRPITEQAQ